MRASPIPTVKGFSPWMAIGLSLLAVAAVLMTAVHWLAGSPQTRATQPAAASPQQAAPTVILTARPAPYTLESLLLLGAAQRIDANTVNLTNPVLVGPGAYLALHAPATTVRMTSTPTGFTSLVGWNGSIELTGAPDRPLTLTSWDPATNSPDQQITDGRAYIRVNGSDLRTRFTTFSHLGLPSDGIDGLGATGSEPPASPATPNIPTVAAPNAAPPTVTAPHAAPPHAAGPTAASPSAAPPNVVSPTAASPPSPPVSTPPPFIHTAPASPPTAVRCNSPTAQEVFTADQLRIALAQARPGAVIHVRDGTYPGHFAITTAATADQPITLCGSRAAILDGGSIDTGYTLHLRNAHHWQLSGFTIHGGQKGLMIDGTSGALIDGLLIHEVGDEAVHLRTGSSDNTVQATTIRRTGLRVAKFGEGIYIGSARSNWCTYTGCEPDRSDRNLIQGNDIADTTAEAIDIKEGTSNGILRGNTFSGAAIIGADSWVDVKGNDWTIADNIGTDTPADGFQTHAILAGWGERNTFRGNTATVNAPGYAINITRRHLGNAVSCTNRAANAHAGLSNIPCQ